MNLAICIFVGVFELPLNSLIFSLEVCLDFITFFKARILPGWCSECPFASQREGHNDGLAFVK